MNPTLLNNIVNKYGYWKSNHKPESTSETPVALIAEALHLAFRV